MRGKKSDQLINKRLTQFHDWTEESSVKMVNSEKAIDGTVPVFMPPRKRQTSKKATGGHNYVDHIVCVQVDGRPND